MQDLNFAEVPVPTPAEHEVLIKVHAAGLNPVDYKIVEGGVSAWQYPHILGLDVAGEIVSVGQGVTNWHVGAGGVGSIAIQLAKLHGCKVFTTASSSKHDYVKQLAPDAIINYRTEDVDKELVALTDGLGVDLIIDTVGKKEAELDLQRLAYNGRLVTIVDVPSLDNVPMFDRGLGMDVVNLGGAHLIGNPYQQADLGRMNAEMLRLIANGDVKPLIEKVIPFDQIIDGLTAIKKHEVVGKLVAKID